MLIYKNSELVSGKAMGDYHYIQGRGILSRLVLPQTRRLRFTNAKRYFLPGQSHLDIGCGDGYLLRRSPCSEAVGIDMRLGDVPVDRHNPLSFDDGSFDLVTMLAVLEHLTDPRFVIEEIARVLKPQGRLVLTTPKRAADKLIRLYVRELDDEHETYFDEQTMTELISGCMAPLGYHSFLFGLNQAFAAEKP